MRAALAALIGLAWPVTGLALELALPGNAVLTREITKPADSYALPVGPFRNGAIPTVAVEGALIQQAWRMDATAITPLQLMAPLRAQLEAAGYELLLDCSGRVCGGFDFRFNTRVLPAPDMFVDLFDYRFVSARRAGAQGPVRHLSILISLSNGAAYIQIIQVAPEGAAPPKIAADPAMQETIDLTAQSFVKTLVTRGHVILSDLSFETGSSDLGKGPFASLEALATFLKTDPKRRLALVGHTDAVGGLEANITLSRHRALSVLERLVSAHGVARGQLDAEGMGYLAPIAPNLTGPGREANRRVEAVVLNTDG